MKLAIGNAAVTQSTGATGKTGTASGKSEARGGFGMLLQAAGLSKQTADKSSPDQDQLLTALAAMAGGLSPQLVLQQSELQAMDEGQGLALIGQAGERNVALLLKDLPLSNAELAQVLQKFGASSELLTVLNSQPNGNPIETLKSHSQLLAEFGSALTQMVHALSAQPQLLVQESQTTALFQSLMKSIQADSDQEGHTVSDSKSQTDSALLLKANSLFGKLQATISTHALQATDRTAFTSESIKPGGVVAAANLTAETSGATAELVKSGSEGQTQQTDSPAAGIVANQSHLQLPSRNLQLEPVVTMRADQFRSEFSETIIKRATLIEAPGRHEFRIILEPQGLGEVEVRIQAINKQISVQLIADSSASKGMLDAAITGLKLQLQAQGIQYDRIEVQTSSQNSTGLGSGMPDQRGSGQQAREQQQGEQSRQVPVDTFNLPDGETLPDGEHLTGESIDVTA
ncbi:hypothetical protein CIG75_12035 [Tumebacillus algifaecis]|uniref:Flagellar hook-length control protein-like C-terminal domain-containing protein n=1 Tax=Tumebacillus algifaecis TaxID=1214604 RepID=A0A223D2P9_9BACL|nr:flagellar hook-length control protein FliK [Tumebacillus algifaecis]ASS75646.1 hypothetical protein CIG75_12035 [Tumebacillus algifaecis]